MPLYSTFPGRFQCPLCQGNRSGDLEDAIRISGKKTFVKKKGFLKQLWWTIAYCHAICTGIYFFHEVPCKAVCYFC